MKLLQFIFVGATRDKNLHVLEEHYLGRITQHHRDSKCRILKDSMQRDHKLRTARESADILAEIKPGTMAVICDERGKSLDSKAFSGKLSHWLDVSQQVVFVVGGAYGFDDVVRQRAGFLLKLSDFTMPHELARVVLLEQVYRAFTILSGKGYHH